jgi:thiol-disulfide isomerase/thioredoxin
MGLIVCVAVLALAGGFGMLWKKRNGQMTAARTGGDTLTAAEIGGPLGGRATLVQFSTAFCAPCRATRVILGDVASQLDGVTHVEIDAESHLELVRKLDIRRTPTVLVLGPDGRIAQRASGRPTKSGVLAAVGSVTGDPAASTGRRVWEDLFKTRPSARCHQAGKGVLNESWSDRPAAHT